MRTALDVHRELLARGIGHEIVRLGSRVLSADDLPRVLGVPGCVAVRCYDVLRPTGAAFAAVLVRAGELPDPAALLDALDAESVRPADTDRINAATEYAAGLVSPFCLPAGVELLADTALGSAAISYCPVGEGGVALGIATRDLLVVTGARVAALSGPAAVERTVLTLPRDPAADSTRAAR